MPPCPAVKAKAKAKAVPAAKPKGILRVAVAKANANAIIPPAAVVKAKAIIPQRRPFLLPSLQRS